MVTLILDRTAKDVSVMEVMKASQFCYAKLIAGIVCIGCFK